MGSLTLGPDTVDLSDDFAWPDEFSWPKVANQKTYSVTGALLVETNSRQTGRPITLVGDEQHAWITRLNLDILRTFVETPGAEMELQFRGFVWNVIFDHEAGALEATPVADYDTPENADFYFITLRFVEVPAP